MFRRYVLLMLLLSVTVSVASCNKTCRCYRYDGDVEEFSMEELQADSVSCVGMETVNFGLTYALCEKV